MNKNEIISFLKENNLSDVEVLKSNEGYILVNFYLDFDKDILAGAKAYADEESNYENGSKEWINEYYFPYLYDFANDEVLSIIEDISEEFEVAGEFMAFQMKNINDEYVQFMTLFTEEESILSIEEVVKDYMS